MRRHSSRWKSLQVFVALAAFLFGTNYCVVAALASPGGSIAMTCHVASQPASPSHGCCGHQTPEPAPTGPASSAMPCCMMASPVAAPELAKSDVSSQATWLVAAALVASCVDAPAPAAFALASTPSPGLTRAPAPSGPRAPPLG